MQIDPVQNINPIPQDSPSKLNEPAISKREIVPAIQALNRPELIGDERELRFGTDQESGEPVIRIVDRRTNKVLRQIPPETLLAIAAELERSGKLPEFRAAPPPGEAE